MPNIKLADIIQMNKSNFVIVDKNTLYNINILLLNSDPPVYDTYTGKLTTPPKTNIAEIPPIYWEEDFMRVVDKIKYIALDGNIYIPSNNVPIILSRHKFKSIDEIIEYIDNEYGDPIIHSIIKTVDLTNLSNGYTYEVRMGFIQDKSEIRQEKISEIID